ncbi:MAG: AMP-binding protein [SAR86 cluster bacterium]|jgi:long-chain acyl-CoA synthetase|nr:AMP-binding protein [SAR86 cluster bacterium]
MPKFAKELYESRPEEWALRFKDKTMNWSDVDLTLNRVANGLQEIDLGPERRIAVFAENSMETAMANLGGLIGGASVVPVNFHLTSEEVAYILENSGARVIFVGPETKKIGLDAAKLAGVSLVVGWGLIEKEEGILSWEEWLLGCSDKEPRMDLKPLPNLLYTSGTTGRPKGTNLPPTMFAAGETIEDHLENLKLSPNVGLGPHLVVGPMYHTGPLSGARLLAAGVNSVILGKFDAEATLEAIDKYKTGTTIMVPTHFVRLLALPQEVKDKYDTSSMVSIAHTGANCPVDTKISMINWFGPVFRDAYGASEVGTTCSLDSEEFLKYPGSVGKAVEPFTAIILDDDGKELPTNEEGKLYFKDSTGRGIIYHNDPEKSKAAHIAPGIFTLGEIAYMNEEGYVFLTDRFSDMVVSGGANIYPAEAEQVLIEHPYVMDVACIGVPNKEMGEELKALIIVDPSQVKTSEKELIDWSRDKISHYKCPRSVEFVKDLGRNTMGKINKRKLKAPYWE